MEPEPGVGLFLLCALLAEARARWAPCDNAKFKLQVDFPPVEELSCPGPVWALPELVIPSLAKVYPEQEATRVCMGEQIVYNMRIPNSGMHRPNWAMYGEYLYVPAQRWVHNLQRGGIAFLYHPCVHSRLKEELSLLARACMYKHIITPHLNLSQERPLALVAWGKSLEMSGMNLAEAVSWLRASVNRACDSVTDDGVYKFLLIQKAKLVSDNNDGVICPADRMKKLQHYFKKKDRPSTVKKWNEVGDHIRRLPNRHVLLRRRRNSDPREHTPTGKQVEVISSEVFVQKNKEDKNSSNFVANVQVPVTTLPTGQAVVTREQLQKTAVTIARDSENVLVRRTNASQETKKESYEIGGRQNRTGNELEVAMSALKDPGEIHPRGFLSSHTADPLKTDNAAAKEPDSQHLQVHNLSHSSLNIRVKPHWTSNQQGEIEKDGRIIGKDNQLVGTPAVKEQEMVKIIVTDSKGLSGDRRQMTKNGTLVSGKNVKPLQPLQNAQISSTNDGMKQNVNSNKSYTGDGDKMVHQGEMEINVTLTLNARDNLNATAAVESGSIKCKCDGVLQNVHVDSEGADSNDLKAAIVKAIPEDRILLYVPTPRTEEAAWAAAALTFLFVFLTLAVLYTRLYKKFVKSDSLYWAPIPGVNGKENVADIIKRRIIRLGKKRKKRPPHKKKSISPYDVLPRDNSD